MSSAESAASVQRQVEQERADLVNTLDQLRENLRPANVIDEMMAGTRVDAAVISDKLWAATRHNPVAAALIGIGGAMLMGVRSKIGPGAASEGRERPTVSRATPAARQRPTPSMADATKDQVLRRIDDAAVRADRSARQIAESAGRLRERASLKAPSFPSAARPGRGSPTREAAMTSSFKSRGLTGSLTSFLDEQPLVLAAIGVAVGAAIGAALPSTDVEGRYMGEASGSVKQSAQDLAQQQYAQLKATATETLDDLKQTAVDHGVSADNFKGLVSDMSGKVRDAAVDAANRAADAATAKG